MREQPHRFDLQSDQCQALVVLRFMEGECDDDGLTMRILEAGLTVSNIACVPNANHNHPSNGWFAQRLKAFITGQRLKALAFTLFKPIAFASFAAP